MRAVKLSNATSLCRKKGFTLLGFLGIPISFRKVKEEPKHPEPISPNIYHYDNQDSAKSPRSNSLSRHAVMAPPCKTSHTFLMSSLKPSCQHKTRKKFPEYFKYEQPRTSKKKRIPNEGFCEMGRVRFKCRLHPEKYPRPSQKARPTIRRRQKNPGTIEANSRAVHRKETRRGALTVDGVLFWSVIFACSKEGCRCCHDEASTMIPCYCRCCTKA